MRTLIIEDNKDAAERLQRMIEGHEKLSPGGIAFSLDDGIAALKKEKPDLVFLDIELPDNRFGFELMSEKDLPPFIPVCVSAHPSYAATAYKNALPFFLEKPIDRDDFEKTIEHVFRKKEEEEVLRRYITLAMQEQSLRNSERLRIEIAIKGGQRELIKLKDIICIEADGNYTNVKSTEKEFKTVTKSLGQFEQDFARLPFMFRCHRGFIINLFNVKGYNISEMSIRFENHAVYLGAVYKDEFLRLMQDLFFDI